MPARKLKVEVLDAKGNRYTLTFEGNVSRDKVLNLLDFIDLLGGASDNSFEWRSTSGDDSKFSRLSDCVKSHFAFRWFDSGDAQKLYEQEFREPISLSTVSTYLARMVDRGLLLRKGAGTKVKYRLATLASQGSVPGLKDNRRILE